jgi:hypothetical protein
MAVAAVARRVLDCWSEATQPTQSPIGRVRVLLGIRGPNVSEPRARSRGREPRNLAPRVYSPFFIVQLLLYTLFFLSFLYFAYNQFPLDGSLFLQFQPATAPHPIEAHRQENIDDLIGDEQAAQHRQRHRGNDFAAHAGRE